MKWPVRCLREAAKAEAAKAASYNRDRHVPSRDRRMRACPHPIGMRTTVLLMLLALSAPAQSLETATVTSAVVSSAVKLPAELLPFQHVAIAARVSGLVERVEVDRGSHVTPGQLLITLAAPEMAAQIAEGEARVEAIEAQGADADARKTAAESTLDKLQTAAKTQGAVAANDLVQAQKAVDSAMALTRALARSAQAARAAVDAQKVLAGYLRISAPFEGVITARYVHPGALASPASGALLELEQVSRLRLVVAVPEADAGGLARQAHVSFTVPAYPGRAFSGVVARIAPSLDAKSRTLPVEADVVNTDGALAAGMYAEVNWPVKRSRASLWTPATAVVMTTERTFVIRVKDGKAEWVNVTRGVKQGELVEVMGPLAAGDVVMKRGTDEIRDGQSVNVKK